MSGELIACLLILFQLLVIDGVDLGQLVPVVSVLNGGLVGLPGSRSDRCVAGSLRPCREERVSCCPPPPSKYKHSAFDKSSKHRG